MENKIEIFLSTFSYPFINVSSTRIKIIFMKINKFIILFSIIINIVKKYISNAN